MAKIQHIKHGDPVNDCGKCHIFVRVVWNSCRIAYRGGIRMELSMNERAKIIAQTTNRSLSFKGVTMIRVSTEYFDVELTNNRMAELRINSSIRMEVGSFLNHSSNTLYRQAIRDYRYSQINGFPFHPYEAVLNYTVTYNESCHLSYYHDRYEYTGGAHGITARGSETWDLNTGWRVPLSSFFKQGTDYQRYVTERIIEQAEKNMAENPGIYFEDYKKLIVQNFNPNSFYITPQGVVVYYQQYDIAPYASGIVEFLLPYDENVKKPNCG